MAKIEETIFEVMKTELEEAKELTNKGIKENNHLFVVQALGKSETLCEIYGALTITDEEFVNNLMDLRAKCMINLAIKTLFGKGKDNE